MVISTRCSRTGWSARREWPEMSTRDKSIRSRRRFRDTSLFQPGRIMTTEIDYSRSCFVIMPFGTKPVGDKMVDFDFIYREVFLPAIEATPLGEGEGGYLE